MTDISPRLTAYLKSWFATSTEKKVAAGIRVTLTFLEFIGLFELRQLLSLEKAIEANSIRYRQSDTNKYAYVLTWQSYAARCSGTFSRETAIICSRMKSRMINLPQKGDTFHAEHRAALSAALMDKPKTEEHCAAISAGKKGRPIAGWSEERKLARRQQIAERRSASS